MTQLIKFVYETTNILCQSITHILLRDLTNYYWYKELENINEQNDLSATTDLYDECSQITQSLKETADYGNEKEEEITSKNKHDNRNESVVEKEEQSTEILNENPKCYLKTMEEFTQNFTDVEKEIRSQFELGSQVSSQSIDQDNKITGLHKFGDYDKQLINTKANTNQVDEERESITYKLKIKNSVYGQINSGDWVNNVIKTNNTSEEEEDNKSELSIKLNSDFENVDDNNNSWLLNKREFLTTDLVDNDLVDDDLVDDDLVDDIGKFIARLMNNEVSEHTERWDDETLNIKCDIVMNYIKTATENKALSDNVSNIDRLDDTVNIEIVNSKEPLDVNNCQSENTCEVINYTETALENKGLFKNVSNIDRLDDTVSIKTVYFKEALDVNNCQSENTCENTEDSETATRNKGLIDNFSDIESTCYDDNWMERFLSEANINNCVSENDNSGDKFANEAQSCDCCERHGCLQVIQFDKEDMLTDELLTDSQLQSVDTSSVSDWLYRVSPAICLQPALGSIDVSPRELQGIDSQESYYIKECYNISNTELIIKHLFVKNWLDSSENFLFTSSQPNYSGYSELVGK